MNTLRQGRDRLAVLPALKDLPVDQARHPDRLAVGRYAFDQPMLRVDGEQHLRLHRRHRRDQREDQRSEPAKSLCSLL